jgi:hypothetical protein
MALDDRGVRPLSTWERRVLAHLERSLADGGRPARRPAVAHNAALHRADRVAAVVGLLVLGGMTAEAAVVGGPILALGVGGAFLGMILAFVLFVVRR